MKKPCPRLLKGCRQQERDSSAAVGQSRSRTDVGYRCCVDKMSTLERAMGNFNGRQEVASGRKASGFCSSWVSFLPCGPKQSFVTPPKVSGCWDAEAEAQGPTSSLE